MMMVSCQNENSRSIAGPESSVEVLDTSSELLSKGRGLKLPIYEEKVVRFDFDNSQYLGAIMRLPGGNSFRIPRGSLIPPAGTAYGEDVTVSILIEKDVVNNELIFTFGPSGCQFSPDARIWLSWKALGGTNPRLYYIDDNGNRIPQTPVEIDYRHKKLKIFISHFSRYGLAAD